MEQKIIGALSAVHDSFKKCVTKQIIDKSKIEPYEFESLDNATTTLSKTIDEFIIAPSSTNMLAEYEGICKYISTIKELYYWYMLNQAYDGSDYEWYMRDQVCQINRIYNRILVIEHDCSITLLTEN